MLHTETVAGSTLGLLKKLEAENVMSDFNLAGGLYERKFPGSNVIRPFKAITYFDDIDFEEDIVMLNCKFDWKLIERRLVDMTKIQNKVFESFPLPQK